MEKYHKRRYVTFHLLIMSSIVCCCWRWNRVGGKSILCLGAVITLLVLTEHSLFCWKKYYQNIIVKEATIFSRILVTAPADFCHYQGDSSASFAWFVWSEGGKEGGREGGRKGGRRGILGRKRMEHNFWMEAMLSIRQCKNWESFFHLSVVGSNHIYC